ncbi:MAG: 50S ribosomal protein L20 [Spirochaetes bacterium]|nr:50S ribosomal protein L20 [Spirochaetota bacterium]
MPRATTGRIHQKRRKKILKDAKGFYGARSVLYRTAKDARRRALQNSYIHRRKKKGDLRTLWIMRINAATRMHGMSYNTFINALSRIGVLVNRKMLADIAVSDPIAFRKLIEIAKGGIA